MDRCGGELALSVCKAKEVSSRTQCLIPVLRAWIGRRLSLLHEKWRGFPGSITIQCTSLGHQIRQLSSAFLGAGQGFRLKKSTVRIVIMKRALVWDRELPQFP